MAKPLLLIQTGEAPEPICARLGGFAAWFRVTMRLRPTQLRIVRVDAGEKLPASREIAGAVITGSGAMVTEPQRWSKNTAGWIRTAMDARLPLFGVCYGHQLMAHALGGRVDWLPGGREIGTQIIERLPRVSDDPLGKALPARLPAHTTHLQAVTEAPRGARVLARSARDPHQLLRYAPQALSTQFHPEFAVRAMRAYLDARIEDLHDEDLDVAALRRAVRPTPEARALLRNFALSALRRADGAAPR